MSPIENPLFLSSYNRAIICLFFYDDDDDGVDDDDDGVDDDDVGTYLSCFLCGRAWRLHMPLPWRGKKTNQAPVLSCPVL